MVADFTVEAILDECRRPELPVSADGRISYRLDSRRVGRANRSPADHSLLHATKGCIEMGRRTFTGLENADAKVLAAAIPRGSSDTHLKSAEPDYLRTDQVFLLERYFYLLEEFDETGVIMDESDKTADRNFIKRLHAYFVRTAVGKSG